MQIFPCDRIINILSLLWTSFPRYKNHIFSKLNMYNDTKPTHKPLNNTYKRTTFDRNRDLQEEKNVVVRIWKLKVQRTVSKRRIVNCKKCANQKTKRRVYSSPMPNVPMELKAPVMPRYMSNPMRSPIHNILAMPVNPALSIPANEGKCETK